MFTVSNHESRSNGAQVNGDSVNEIVKASEMSDVTKEAKKVTIVTSAMEMNDIKKANLVKNSSVDEMEENGENDDEECEDEDSSKVVSSKNGVPVLKKLGKKIRLRRKKDKIKTENRAKKALRTISFILGAFVTCWTPYHIFAIMTSFYPGSINVHVYMVSYFLCYLNSPVNPFCYAAANQQFKNAFKRIMTGDLSLK